MDSYYYGSSCHCYDYKGRIFLMRYMPVDNKTFRLQKEAEKWVKEQKKEHAGTVGIRTDVNYLEDTNQWQGVVYMRVEM